MDKGTKTELQDCFDTWVQTFVEADELHERKSLQEECKSQCNVGTNCHRAAIRRDKNLELDWDSLLSLATENGWAKDQEDMAKLLREKK